MNAMIPRGRKGTRVPPITQPFQTDDPDSLQKPSMSFCWNCAATRILTR